MRQYCQGVHEKKCFEMIEKENTEIRFKKNTARNCAIRNTMTNSTSKQQHCSGRTSSKSETRNSDRNTCQVHTNTYSCVIPHFTVHLRSIRSRHPVVKPHRMPKKGAKNGVHQIKKQGQALRGSNLRPHSLAEYKLPFIHPLYGTNVWEDNWYMSVRNPGVRATRRVPTRRHQLSLYVPEKHYCGLSNRLDRYKQELIRLLNTPHAV